MTLEGKNKKTNNETHFWGRQHRQRVRAGPGGGSASSHRRGMGTVSRCRAPGSPGPGPRTPPCPPLTHTKAASSRARTAASAASSAAPPARLMAAPPRPDDVAPRPSPGRGGLGRAEPVRSGLPVPFQPASGSRLPSGAAGRRHPRP